MNPSSPSIHNSPRKSNRPTGLPIYLLSISILLFLFFQLHSLHTPFLGEGGGGGGKGVAAKLRQSVTFLPLKDLRYANAPMDGHTWFMSSLNDTRRDDGVQYQKFPSEASAGRVLCLAGRDAHDGSKNWYGLAWPESLPEGATLARGVTFVSNSHYDYDNIWHGLSAAMPFVGCGGPVARRWVLYHWGEVRTYVAPWVKLLLMQATLGGGMEIESMEDYADVTRPVCFEEAVVMRHDEAGMSEERKMEVYDLIRCKSRMYCNVSSSSSDLLINGGKKKNIGMTLLMREGGRSFKDGPKVIEIFERECLKVEGCRLTVAYTQNLTVCQQVKLMSETDILVSPHGAQLTNIFLMDRESSVMEFFPKGWLETAGVGQYVYHWIAGWSGMRHEGAWRDPDGEQCPFTDNDRCFWVYKNAKIGHNETYFSEWAQTVLRKRTKMNLRNMNPVKGLCGCR